MTEETILEKIKETYQKGQEPYKDDNQTLEGKDRILRIITRYNDMMLLTGVYSDYNDAFLKSDESRRAMLTTGCYILEGGEITLNKPEKDAFYWPGCDMAIPEKANIILSFNNPYPSVYIKKENGEIFIEESSWHINYIDNDNLLESVTGIDKKNVQEGAFLKGKKTEKSNPAFQTIDMKVKEALKNYDIVVQVPYITPSADMLLKVSFNGKDEKDEIILSTC